MGGLSSITSIGTSANALANLILVTAQTTIGYQPQGNPASPNSQPPPALLFHYEGEQSVALESDITDHFIEDNTSIQDQIALKPETITTHGFIGELNDIAPGFLKTLQSLVSGFTLLGPYAPKFSATALFAFAQAFQAYQLASNTINTGIAAWSSLSGSSGESVINGQGITVNSNQTKQQVAFQQFYGYWRSRTLFTVQTPWAVFQNMAIKSLRAIQDAETRMITDFEVSFKLIRTASTTTASAPSVLGRLSSQAAGLTDLGTSTPVSSTGLTSGIGSSFPGQFAGVG